MLEDLFYLFGLLIYFLSLIRVFRYFKFIDSSEWILAFKKVTKNEPTKDDFRDPEDYNLIVTLGCLSVIETIWIILGLITNEWIIFFSIFLFSVLLRQVFNFLSIRTKKIFGLFSSILKSLIILILVLNHFHLHLDITNIIISLFI